MIKENFDVVILGGGASGMAAAIEVKRHAPSAKVLIIEKNESLGSKIRATGNGRCNITNVNADGYDEAVDFLKSIGLPLRTYENGLVYPYSESAADVNTRLVAALEEAKVKIHLLEEAKKASYDEKNSCFNVETSKGLYTAKNLVLSLGGKAGPSFGTIGDGYRIARGFGHTVVSPIPILTGIECENQGLEKVSGVRAICKASLFKGDEELFCEEGELQLTKYGLSGICIFNMTRFMRFQKGESISDFEIKINLFPEGSIEEFIEDQKKIAGENSLAGTIFSGLLKEKLAKFILKRCDIDENLKVSMLDDEMTRRLGQEVSELSFRPTGIRGWKEAQATAGGVLLDEIDSDTSESKLCRGLYITGELADYDGPCGGYNLTYAWNSGRNAGKSICKKQKNEAL